MVSKRFSKKTYNPNLILDADLRGFPLRESAFTLAPGASTGVSVPQRSWLLRIISNVESRYLFFNKSQIGRCFPSAADIELIKYVVDMILDRPNFDHKLFGDLLIGSPFTN